MPGSPRFDVEGLTYHVYSRGVLKNPIFRDRDDRLEFLRRLKRVTSPPKASIFAWALLDNHFHLVLRRMEFSLEDIFRSVLGGYSRWFNKKHDRRGILFEKRYGSRPIFTDSNLSRVIRYVSLNPLKHRVVGSFEELAAYEWSNFRYLESRNEDPLGNAEGPCCPGADLSDYQDFDFTEHRSEWYASPELSFDDGRSVVDPSALNRSWTRILAGISRSTGLPHDAIRFGGRRADLVAARRVFCRDAIRIPGATLSGIACYLGKTPSAIYKMLG